MEQYSNNPTTTLNGAINNSTTSVVVSSAASFPTGPTFRILIDSEIMKVTNVSGNTFTVVRAQEGTTAVSHSNAVNVDGLLTKAAFDQIEADVSGLAGATASVTLYGAKGDGSTDDTTVIQNAINAVQSTGGIVYFPPGTYKVSALTVDADNVRLVGTGYKSIIAKSSATGDTITIGSTGQRQGCGVENLAFVPSVTRTSGAEIHVVDFLCLRLMGLKFDTVFHCIDIGNVTNRRVIAWIDKIRAVNFTRFLYMVNVLDVWVSNCSTDANTAAATSVVIEGGVESCDFVNCDFVNSAGSATGYALQTRAVDFTATPPSYLQFTNCYFDSHDFGHYADAGKDITFTNCWFSCRPGDGVTIHGANCESLVYDACRAENCGGNGFLVSAGKNHSFSACEAISNNVGSTGANGFSVNANYTGGVRINSCRSYNRTSFGGSQASGIFIDNGCDNFIVTSNDTRGNVSAGITNGSGTGTTKIVANNI